ATQGASENVPLVLLAGATGPHNKNNIAVKPYILTEIQKFSCYVWALHLKSNTGHGSVSGLGDSAAAAAPQLAQMRLMRRRAAGLPVVAMSGTAPGSGAGRFGLVVLAPWRTCCGFGAAGLWRAGARAAATRICRRRAFSPCAAFGARATGLSCRLLVPAACFVAARRLSTSA